MAKPTVKEVAAKRRSHLAHEQEEEVGRETKLRDRVPSTPSPSQKKQRLEAQFGGTKSAPAFKKYVSKKK